jgi:hypothetical protein
MKDMLILTVEGIWTVVGIRQDMCYGSWVSRLQSTVASSLGEAEYMSGYDLVQAMTWTEGVCQELGIYLLKNGPIQCFMDNKSAIILANNPVFHKRTKHIRIKYHWLRQKVAEGLVTLIYVQSEQNIADIFTNIQSPWSV